MKITAYLFIVIASVACLACSDDQQDKKTDLNRHQNSAKTYQEQGQLKAAILEAKKMIQVAPDSSSGYLQAAKIYNQIGAFSASQKLLESKVKAMPDVAAELAESYLGNKKYRTALTTLSAYPANSNNHEAVLNQMRISAIAYFYLGELPEYNQALAKFTELGGSAQERQYLEANVLLSQGKVADAQKNLQSILAVKPEDQKALILLGTTYAANREFDKAESQLTKALGLLPNTDIMSAEKVKVLSLLTDVLINQGRSSEAYVYQKILAEANPESNAAQQRFNDAVALYQEGKFSEAEVILNELREQFPKDKNSATLLGMIEFQKGENGKASTLFDEFIDAETSSPIVIQAAALVKYRNNQVDEALVLLKKAAENQPNNAIILSTYGLAVLDNDSKSKAGVEALEKSLAINPDQQRLRLALAKQSMAIGDVDKGLAQLRKAYEETPLDVMLQEAYLRALFANKQSDLVKKEVDKFKAAYPDNARGYFVEGWYFMETKDYSAAEKSFEKSLAVPGNTEKKLSYTGLAQLYQLQNKPQQAIEAWQNTIEADPKISASYGYWLNLMWANDKKEQAFTYLLKIEKANPNLWQPSIVLAQLYANNKQWTEAEKHIDVALSRDGTAEEVKKVAATIYQLKSIDFRESNNVADARRYMLKAVELFPNNPDYLANMIEVEIAANKLDEAQKLLNEYPQNDSNVNVRQFYQGSIRFAENKPEEGMKLYLESWSSKPTEVAALAIAEVYEINKQQQTLDKFINEWIEKLPRSAKATMYKALQAQKINNNREAIKWYEKTIELAPTMAVALNNLAWSYYLVKDERAIAMAKKAYEAAPTSASVVDTYGWILVETGNVKLGSEILAKALALAPGNAEIKAHINSAKSR